MHEARKVTPVFGDQFGLRHILAQHFLGDGVQQQARRGEGVVRVFFDQRARCQDGRLVDLVHRHAVVQIAHRFRHDRVCLDIKAQPRTSICNQRLQPAQVQRIASVAIDHVQHRVLGRCLGQLACTLLGMALAVQHISARHFMVAAAHQAQFDLVLHVLDVEGAAAWARAHQCTHHVLRQRVHHFAHAGRGSALGATHCQKGFHQGDGDFLRFKLHDRAVAAQDLVVR